MQATGMVNDHLTSCFRYKDLRAKVTRVIRLGPGAGLKENEGI